MSSSGDNDHRPMAGSQGSVTECLVTGRDVKGNRAAQFMANGSIWGHQCPPQVSPGGLAVTRAGMGGQRNIEGPVHIWLSSAILRGRGWGAEAVAG